MGFLDRLKGLGGDDEDDAEQQARERDIARIESGSIPLAAEQRIRELVAGTAFTSGLSVADFALTRLEQIRPVCQVMGTSVYKVGWQNYPWSSGWGSDASLIELTALTNAWNDARARALGRLAEEASHAGSHAVVDVTFDNRRHEFLSDEIEVLVNGTAVHLPEGTGASNAPVLTDLSLPDYVLLRRAGYVPVGVVASTSVFYIVPSRQTRRMTTGWQRTQPNQELTDFTQGVYEARESALGRASAQARALGAGGLVGMSVEHHVAVREVEQNNQTREDLIVTFHIIGTAIAPSGEHRPLDPQTILRLGLGATKRP
ncbi:MAG TPA: heavy metal-binding domain-containing protein [Solirubrobacteraceae bacterium]|jgi:uncharacterized protein YbjQ (UPF0145 family)|nr:heavy metal-binding domain-containing protein [Solirubrobacteraceae bacterium]